MTITLLQGDARAVLPTLPSASVQCVVTSPPYYGLRSYLPTDHPDKAAEIGSERTPAEYVAALVEVFREVKRILRPDGICFLNIGDLYCSGTQNAQYSLRQDCSLEELQDVALAVFGVRFAGDEEASQRSVPRVLYDSRQGKTLCGESALASGRVEESLHSASSGSDCANIATQPPDQDRRDNDPRGEMCLLWGNDTAVSNSGPHPRGRGGTQKASDRQEPSVLDQDIPRGETPRLSEGSLSGAVFQLQLRDRLMGLLSARKFTDAEIPSSVRACFEASPALKPKQLLMMPARVALALQADGWFLRSDIIWAKPNPMPESVTDRPTSAHEHVFLLAKSARYYFDQDAIRRKPTGRTDQITSFGHVPDRNDAGHHYPLDGLKGANACNVWTIATAPFSEAHFATFPPALVERCVKAGTSERGCCAACGTPWARLVERGPSSWEARKASGHMSAGYHAEQGAVSSFDPYRKDLRPAGIEHQGGLGWVAEKRTTGWTQPCGCRPSEPVPCVVLDPFSGAGTTAMVADRLGRHAIGIDLSPTYGAMSRERIVTDAGLFADFAPAAQAAE